MRRCLHLWPYFAFAGVTVIAVTLDRFRLPAEDGPRAAVAELPRLEAAAELDQRLAACHALTRARERIIYELLDGRTTLLAAAERFRDLSEASVEFRYDQFRAWYPGPSDDVRHCRHVIAFTEEVLRHEPERAAIAIRRLQEELDDLVQRDAARLGS
jgi:hypothetical protein